MHPQTLSPRPCTKQESKEKTGKEREKKREKEGGEEEKRKRREGKERKRRKGKRKGRKEKKKRGKKKIREGRKKKRKEKEEKIKAPAAKGPCQAVPAAARPSFFAKGRSEKATECDPGARQKKQVFHFYNFIFFCMAR